MLPLNFGSKYAVVHTDDPEHDKLAEHIEASEKEITDRAPGYELVLRAHTSMIYSYILRKLSVSEEPSPIQSEANAANLDLIRNALEYIEEHYAEPITMQQIAKEANVNYYYFSRLFQQYTNQGFRDYLMKFRINRAVRMLLQTNESVTNIAIDCGFETISYFIKKFQEEMGVTPKNFRKQYFSIEDPNIHRTDIAQYVDAPNGKE
jgi:YesN/AraC family two-component response regulator